MNTIPSKIALLVLFLSRVAAVNATTNWIDGVGDWFNPANWSAGVPTSGNRGQIGNGGTAQIAADAGNADVSVGVNFVSGNLVVSGSGRLNGSVDVGFSGNGTLMISDGGMVTNSVNPVIGLTGPGVAIVTGVGSSWTHTGNCRIGDWDLGTLKILAGGKVVTGSVSIGGTSIGGSATI
ncbi:MAG: hypothetical protein ACJ8HQ_04840, partial [Chthoniobacterales bacterium]